MNEQGLLKNFDKFSPTDILEKLADIGHCPCLINDDNGNWAVASDGWQNIRGTGGDLETTLIVRAEFFKPTISEAVRLYLEQCTSEEKRNGL